MMSWRFQQSSHTMGRARGWMILGGIMECSTLKQSSRQVLWMINSLCIFHLDVSWSVPIINFCLVFIFLSIKLLGFLCWLHNLQRNWSQQNIPLLIQNSFPLTSILINTFLKGKHSLPMKISLSGRYFLPFYKNQFDYKALEEAETETASVLCSSVFWIILDWPLTPEDWGWVSKLPLTWFLFWLDGVFLAKAYNFWL